MHLRDLGRQELMLFRLYTRCQFGMSPQAFYAKWNVSHAQMAKICGCAIPTVDRWFASGQSRRSPRPLHLRKLAEMDFIWEFYEEIPLLLLQQLCATPPHSPQDLSP